MNRIFLKIIDSAFYQDVILKSSYTFMLQIGTVVVTYLFHIMIASLLGSKEYGTYVFVLSWTIILATPASFGFQTSTIKFISKYSTENNLKLLKGFLNKSIQIPIILSLCISVAGIVILYTTKTTDIKLAFILAMVTIPFMVAANIQGARIKAIHRAPVAQFFIFLSPLLVLISIIILTHFHISLTSTDVLVINISSIIIIIFFQFYLLRKALYPKIKATIQKVEVSNWLKVSIPLMLIAEFQMLLTKTDILMIGSLVSTQAAGIYNIATKTATIVSFILVAVSSVVAPKFSSLFSKHRIKELQLLITRSSHLVTWLSLILLIGVLLISNNLIGFIGNEYLEAKGPLVVLLIGQFVNAVAGPVGVLLNMTGHQNSSAIIYGSIAIINILFNFILINIMGTIGAAYATTITMIIWNLLISIYVINKLKIYPTVFGPFIIKLLGD
jgi:O-antigen/teichoic acid export membrane protein